MMDIAEDDHLRALERRARRRRALRIKQLTGILTTAGYGLVAGGGWEPLLKAQPFGLTQALAFGLGVATLGISVYIAPEGEVADVGR